MLFRNVLTQISFPQSSFLTEKFPRLLGNFSLLFFLTIATKTVAQPLQIGPGITPPPPISGQSGGPNNSGDCGYISNSPNLIFQATENLPFLRIRVQTQGVPTLLVQGPTGRFCVLPDTAGSGMIDMSGFANKGTYSVFIGDRAQGQHPFTLIISPQR